MQKIEDVEFNIIKSIQNVSSLYVMISVTRQCVLSCKYCYAINQSKKKEILTHELLEKIIKDSFDTEKKEIKFEWTGGESFLAGINFYKQVTLLQKKHAKKNIIYKNCIQTSGALLDKELIDYLIDNQFNIGITIDGDEEIHNWQRPRASGANSHHLVINSFEYIKKKQGRCGVLCTITKKNVENSIRLINYFNQLGVSGWHSNLYSYDERKLRKDKSIAIEPYDYYEYFKSQVDYYLSRYEDEYPIPETIKMFFYALAGREYNSFCTNSGRCIGTFINIDPAGNCFVCPKFLGLEKYSIGNIKNNTISECISLSSSKLSSMIRQRAVAVKICLDNKCIYFNVCKSGCPYLSTVSNENGAFSNKDPLCEAKYNLFQYIERRLSDFGIETYSELLKQNIDSEK